MNVNRLVDLSVAAAMELVKQAAKLGGISAVK